MIRKDLLRLATHLITKVDSVDKNMMENFESANDEKIISTVKKQQRRIEQIMEYMKGAFNDYEGIPKAILEEKRKFNESIAKYREEDENIKEALKRGEQMVEIYQVGDDLYLKDDELRIEYNKRHPITLEQSGEYKTYVVAMKDGSFVKCATPEEAYEVHLNDK